MGKRKKKKEPKGLFLLKDGNKLGIMRPYDAKLAIARSKQLEEERRNGVITDDEHFTRRFRDLLTEQPHTFVGFAGRKPGTILDADGLLLPVKPKHGDSYIDYAYLVEKGFAEDES